LKQKVLSLILVLMFTFSLSSTTFAADNGEPQIYGKAAVTIDMKTGEIIYAKDIDRPHMFPASTTKMMTALLFAENKKKTDIITYTQSGKTQPEYSLNLNMHPMRVGDTMTAEAALDALLLYSANDMAYVIADNVAGSSDKFVQMMNDKVKSMGLTGTHFVTPNGIDNGIDDHYTTPYELARIGMEAFKNPWVRDTMGTKTSRFTTSDGVILNLENRNKLLGGDGCIGGKTGYTAKSGRCLVAFYNRDGRELMGVVMDSLYDSNDSYVFNDMKKIIDWSYSAQKSNYKKSGDVVKTVDVTYKQFKYFGSTKTAHIPVVLKDSINIYNNEVTSKEIKEEVNISPIDIWKLNKDTSIGTLNVKERNSTKSYKLYSQVSSSDVVKSAMPLLIGICAAAIAAVVLIIILFARISRARRRRKRRYH
jgi:D-alanyl-D-alanine carboxypeptidase